MYSLLSGSDFQILCEEVDGNNWIHLECSGLSISSFRRIRDHVEPKLEEIGSLYCSIDHQNMRVRRLVTLMGFKHVCNIRIHEGVRSIYIREKSNDQCDTAGARCT